MKYEEALSKLVQDGAMFRQSWGPPRRIVTLAYVDKEHPSELMMVYPSGRQYPFVPTDEELTVTNWILLNPGDKEAQQ